MSFIFPALAIAGVAMMLLPPLIHLINMMRHRRVKWAAMDFLLASYKKNRNYIWLKQLMLLLARMAALLLLGLMLAGMGCYSQISQMLGGKTTRHYVLLDDSFSMSDQYGGDSAFVRAKQAVDRIATRAAAMDGRHEITIIRYSKAGGGSDEAIPGEEVEGARQVVKMADVVGHVVDDDFRPTWEEISQTLTVSDLSVGPLGAIEVVRDLIEPSQEDRSHLYLVSDFRQKDWDSPSQVRSALNEIHNTGATVHLISCVDTVQTNLGIVGIAPAEATQAAGVPLYVNVDVKNFSDEPKRQVQLKVQSIYYDQGDESLGEPSNVAGSVEELPVVLIEEIKPGETVRSRVQVYFPAPGKHVVKATLPDDAIKIDNERYCVINFPDGVPVLVIDGDIDQKNAYFLDAMFNPSFLTEEERAETDSYARSGVKPEAKQLSYLRDVKLEALEKYRVVYLLDVPTLDPKAVETLEAYVRGGGGVAFFVGPNVNFNSYNARMYRDGEGLFPVPLDREMELLEDNDSDVPDISAEGHPMFEGFASQRSALASISRVERYLRPIPGWEADPDNGEQVLATLRGGDPLAVEKRLDNGRVVAFLTTIAPQWNNMGRLPPMPVIVYNTQSYLESAGKREVERLTGTPISLQLEATKYQREVNFVSASDGGTPLVVTKNSNKSDEEANFMDASLGIRDENGLRSGETDKQGIYEAWLFSPEGVPEVRRYALNVNTSESDLSVSKDSDLEQYLSDANPQLVRWDQFVEDPEDEAGASFGLLVFVLLILLLLGEQMLAYSASYHTKRGGTR